MSEATTLDHGLPQHAVDRLRDVFRQWPQIERVILYGSRAKGNYRRGSDIDLCVVGEDLAVNDLLKLDGEIDDLLLPWKVDLSLHHMIEDPELVGHIQRVGCPIFDRSTHPS